MGACRRASKARGFPRCRWRHFHFALRPRHFDRSQSLPADTRGGAAASAGSSPESCTFILLTANLRVCSARCIIPVTRTGHLAARIARLLALAHQTLTREDRPGSGERVRRRSLSGFAPAAQSGGEQWRDNIYLYDLDTPRSSIEWLREIVHEYSPSRPAGCRRLHSRPSIGRTATLANASSWRWCLSAAPDGPAHVETAVGRLQRRVQLRPAFDRSATGPLQKDRPQLRLGWRTGTKAGMRYLIGQALTFDDKYGAARLGDAFRRLPHFREATAKDFAAALWPSHSPRRPISTSPPGRPMTSLTREAHAKINLTLDVGPRRPGWLSRYFFSIMQTITLHDTLTSHPHPRDVPGVHLEVFGRRGLTGVPADESNLVHRAAVRLQKIAAARGTPPRRAKAGCTFQTAQAHPLTGRAGRRQQRCGGGALRAVNKMFEPCAFSSLD